MPEEEMAEFQLKVDSPAWLVFWAMVERAHEWGIAEDADSLLIEGSFVGADWREQATTESAAVRRT